jgi:hypothetical protein
MGFFNFIETFFFISLGITFVLILLLVYHFKQRMNALEQKCDTMFEIINNIVKELTVLRNTQVAPPMFYGAFPSNMNEIYKQMENTGEKVLVSDDDTSGSDYDTNNEEDEESDGEEDGEESDGEESDGEESDGEEENNDPEKKTIKIVNVNISDTIDVEEINNTEQLDDADGGDEDNNGIEPIEVDNIHVEKLNPIVADDVDDSTSITSTNKEVYKKMTLAALKTIAITKGLCSDASKLKKTDLLKLLEESE